MENKNSVLQKMRKMHPATVGALCAEYWQKNATIGWCRKLLHVRPDLLEQIHGRDVCRAWNCSACSVLPAQVDHNHILLIPKL